MIVRDSFSFLHIYLSIYFLLPRRQLRKAVVDHVSDSFLEADGPLLMLISSAQQGKEQEVEEFAQMFTEHANKLVEVANLACSMSNNDDGVKMVRYAASQIENLCPQVLKTYTHNLLRATRFTYSFET